MKIRQTVLDAIAAHARRESPRECCGLLIGNDARIDDAVATSNVAVDPVRRYEISPVEYLAHIKKCRALAEPGRAPLEVIGAYHSHPRSAPRPSPTDIREAFEGFLFVIAGPVEGPDPFTIHGYRLVQGNLQPVELVPEAVEARP